MNTRIRTLILIGAVAASLSSCSWLGFSGSALFGGTPTTSTPTHTAPLHNCRVATNSWPRHITCD